MKPEVKAFYIDENVNLEEIENCIADNWGVVPTGSDRILILAKAPKQKIAVPKEK